MVGKGLSKGKRRSASKKEPRRLVDVGTRAPQPRARAKRETSITEDGVRFCMALMTDAEWRTGVSDIAVATRFGVSVHTARQWASESTRTLRILIGDSEDVRARLVVLLEDIHAQARHDGDWKAAVAALGKQGDLLGLVEKPSVAVQVNVQSYAALDDASMLDKVNVQIAKLEDVRARLLAKQRTLPVLPAHVEVQDVER